MATIRPALALAAHFLLIIPSHGSLQAQATPRIGDTIRVTATGEAPETGHLLRVTEHELVLLTRDGVQRSFPRSDVQNVDTWTEGERQVGRTLGTTMCVMALAGGVVGAVSWSPCESSGLLGCVMHPSRSQLAAGGAVIGAIIAIPVGLVIGTRSRGSWEPGTLPEAAPGTGVTFRVTPDGGRRFRLSGSIPVGGQAR